MRGAQEMGELDLDEDPAQLAFEIDAMLKMATAVFMLHDDAEALERARRGVETRVAPCEDRGVSAASSLGRRRS